jgi:hypothetical protein
MKEPTRSTDKTKAPKIRAPRKAASMDVVMDASDVEYAEVARLIARLEITIGDLDGPQDRDAQSRITALGRAIGNAEGELVDPSKIVRAAKTGDFSELTKYPPELKLARALHRRYQRDEQIAPRAKTSTTRSPNWEEERRLLIEQTQAFVRSLLTRGGSGYSPSTPQQEGRTAGDNHAANDLRHERNVTGARAETTQRQPKQLTSHERQKFLAHAKAHQWDSRGDVRPSDHIRKTFARWLKHGLLARADIVAAQANLAQAYSTEISRNPERRIEEIVVRPHGLPPGAKRALSMSLVSELTPQELERKRAMEREKKQRQRLRKKPKNLAQ